MKLLSNYNEYIVEFKLTESLKTFPLFLSKRLRNLLSQIDHEIATEILSKHSDLDSRVKRTFVDTHDTKADSITFTQPNKAMQILGWTIEDEDELTKKIDDGVFDDLKDMDDKSDLYTKYRSPNTWGRFINAVFPDKYVNSLPGGQNKQDIESFVNLYKALYNRDDKFKLMEIVNGDDIARWYHCDYYFDDNSGTMGESCMKRVDSDYFDIYTQNKDKVSLIIMYTDDRKLSIKARAILWKLDKPENRMFMDRVYTNDYSDEQIYIDYAIKNNWIYKSSQSMGSDVNLIDPSTGDSRLIQVISDLNDVDYEYYPYCDTMVNYNPNTGQISNKTSYINAEYELIDTDGGRYTLSSYNREPTYVYSEYHGEDIDEADAKFCKYGNDWVRNEDAIRVFNSGGENYAIEGHPDIVQSKFDNYNKHFLKSKCIWSEYLSTWLFESSVNYVWTNLEKTDVIKLHKKQKDIEFFEINGEKWFKDLVKDGQLINEVTEND